MTNRDLNFLYVIDALYSERSVSRAADKLGLTQSAVSHCLGRLRERFSDQLFVRSGMGMMPTPQGQRVALNARRILAQVQTEIWDASVFDPLTSDRNFSIGMTDMGGTVALPRVLKRLALVAPNVRVEPVAVQPPDVARMLESGVLDLAWGYFGDLTSTLYQQTLYRRPLAGIWRRGRGEVADFDTFVSAAHVLASTTTLTNGLLKRLVKARGRELRVGLVCPYILAIPALVAHSDYIATVPAELAQIFGKLAEIDMFALPLDIPDIVVKQHWHARNNDDAGHRWLRSAVFQILSEDADQAK
ncbi:LysR family transcriptional regulator [Pusillimonas sp. NJUB218]|uniref:LysR family transcriptional regulator n=1 Tax=Pusillimonas sp. NJUB218 TaxID=2023230 RepID=UPI000F4D1493|nr:LysR family transcriptional regulator [Pusillimonas sp. NJUB218]ROT46478.1 LysR family transcriptional regulator [Pusillimonas sp. NJUB218]